MASCSATKNLVQKLSAGTPTDTAARQSLELLSLPYDVRVPIYKAILVSAEEITIDTRNPRTEWWENLSNPLASQALQGLELAAQAKDLFDNSPNNANSSTKGASELDINVNLLRTCKMVYEQALPILYGMNVFFFMGNAEVLGDFDGLISGRAQRSLAYIRLGTEKMNQYVAQLEYPYGTRDHYGTLWLDICWGCPGLKKVDLDLTDAGQQQGERAERLVSFMIDVAMKRTHGEEARIFPQIVAKIRIVEGGLAPGIASWLTYPRTRRLTLGAFESPPSAKIEFTSAFSAESIQELAIFCEGRWTSTNIKDGVLDDTVTVGSDRGDDVVGVQADATSDLGGNRIQPISRWLA